MHNSKGISQKHFTKLYVLIHVLTWTMVLMLPFVFFEKPVSDLSLRGLLIIAKGIIIFYINYLILVPKLLLNKRVGLYLLSVILFITLNITINYLFPPKPKSLHFEEKNEQVEFPKTNLNSSEEFNDWNPDKQIEPPRHTIFLFSQLTLSLLIIGIGTSLKLAEVFFKNQKQSEEIKREQLNTELNFLKAQINPHFLFNSLNSIYSLAHKKSDLAPESIVRLSKIMRYVIDDSNREKVSLQKEIEHLVDYIELQKLRLTNKTQVTFSQNTEDILLQIEPMLLVSFIENAFKHGIDNINDSLIEIEVSLKKSKLKFTCTNTIARNRTETKEANSGIGFQNVKRRLELLYPKQHKLEILNGNNIFSVNLTLNLRS